MEVKCPTHPGAFTLESQLLDEAAPMASKSWQPSHERNREETREGRARTLSSNEEWRYNKHEASKRMWTTEDR